MEGAQSSTDTGGLLHTICIDTSKVPPEEQFQAWAACMNSHDVSQPDGKSGFGAHATIWRLGPLVVNLSTLETVRIIRTPQKILADGQDHYALLLVLSGSAIVRYGQRAETVGPGDISIVDFTKPVDSLGANVSIGVAIPRDMLDEALPPFDMHGLKASGGSIDLLKGYLELLVKQLPQLTLEEAEPVARATRDMIAACLYPLRRLISAATPSPPPALAKRAQRYIDANLTKPLTTDVLCETLHISRSSLYSLFSSFGGVVAYVRHRRLARIHDLLLRPAEHRTITELAQLHGFHNKTHFSRAFRAEFGCSAAEVRALGIRARSQTIELSQGAATKARTYRSWKKTLNVH